MNLEIMPKKTRLRKRSRSSVANLNKNYEHEHVTKHSRTTIDMPRASPESATDLSVCSVSCTDMLIRGKHLTSSFYNKPGLELAKLLLGKLLVRQLPHGIISGMIVETEAYLGSMDPAAHSFKGQTDRNLPMFMEPGTAYVYNIYGLYCCMNISSDGLGHAVLIRALEPKEGLSTMRKFRQARKKTSQKPVTDKDLCSGPSKLCQALAIDKTTINKIDLGTSETIWLENGENIDSREITVTTRIGIQGCGAEAATKPWRFYVSGNPYVSKRDKTAEQRITSA